MGVSSDIQGAGTKLTYTVAVGDNGGRRCRAEVTRAICIPDSPTNTTGILRCPSALSSPIILSKGRCGVRILQSSLVSSAIHNTGPLTSLISPRSCCQLSELAFVSQVTCALGRCLNSGTSNEYLEEVRLPSLKAPTRLVRQYYSYLYRKGANTPARQVRANVVPYQLTRAPLTLIRENGNGHDDHGHRPPHHSQHGTCAAAEI